MLPPPPAQALPDDLLEEIFLRLPPDEPGCLVRASLASKLWLGLLSGDRFRGRYREFHGAPPMLGFLRSWPPYSGQGVPDFVSTTKFGLDIPDDGWWGLNYRPLDCRHGRVVLAGGTGFVVWDPMTDNRMKLEAPDEYIRAASHGAAMLCGCDHRACHQSPFGVVFVYLHEGEGEDDFIASAGGCVSEPAEWSKLCPDVHQWSEAGSDIHLEGRPWLYPSPPVLAQDALHFMLSSDDYLIQILKYDFDLSSCCLSLIDAPLDLIDADLILLAMEDGSLGVAQVGGFTLYRWSRQMGSDGVASWTQLTIIDLEKLLPIQNPKSLRWKEIPELVGSVEGSDTIFVTMDLGIYEINLKTLRWKSLCKGEKFRRLITNTRALIPYMSFYNPQERASTVMRHIDDV
ncbi:uncharacterized protein LOC125553114 [Triticum urartu]|uniref:uncharacterized protein LOC125553114 n=1 Tax=Triticum urartu TaxID=4572 RepID=UPI002044740E|nr:uncharacterized protein LOC125553114 [Triticum urartu]